MGDAVPGAPHAPEQTLFARGEFVGHDARTKTLSHHCRVTEWTIRRAREADTTVLTAIALAAKRHWGYPADWIESWREELTVTTHYVRRHEVQVAEADGRIVGFYGLTRRGDEGEIDHLWIEPNSMDQGLGRVLWRHALERGRALGCTRLLVDADPNAAGFYERMGARRCGEIDAAMDGRSRTRPQYAVDL